MTLLTLLNSQEDSNFKNCAWVKELIENSNVRFDGYSFEWEQGMLNAPEIKSNHKVSFTVYFKKSFNTRKVKSLRNKKNAFSICELKREHHINGRLIRSESCLVLCFDGKPILESETASISSLTEYARHEINNTHEISYLSEPQTTQEETEITAAQKETQSTQEAEAETETETETEYLIEKVKKVIPAEWHNPFITLHSKEWYFLKTFYSCFSADDLKNAPADKLRSGYFLCIEGQINKDSIIIDIEDLLK